MTNQANLNFPRPLTTVDMVIFTVRENLLQVLLVQRPNDPREPFPDMWALPGGFINTVQDTDLESCAQRKLKEKTGVSSPYLEQLGSWGDAKRDPRGWSATHVYFALIPAEQITLEKGANAHDVRWFPISQNGVAQRLAFDHTRILEAALTRLRNKVEYTSLPAYLLSDEFTLSDLQRMYEIILERPIEKSAFRTRILATDLISPVAKMREGANRPAQLYRLQHPDRLVYFPRTFKPQKD